MKVAELTEDEIMILTKSFATIDFIKSRWDNACRLIHDPLLQGEDSQDTVHRILKVLKDSPEFQLFWKLQDMLGKDRVVESNERSWLIGLEEHLMDLLKGLDQVDALLGRLIDSIFESVKTTFKDAEVKHHRNHRPGLPTYLFKQGDTIFHFKFNEDSLDLDFPHNPVNIPFRTLTVEGVIEKIGRYVYNL
jgi:hypothetical protein